MTPPRSLLVRDAKALDRMSAPSNCSIFSPASSTRYCFQPAPGACGEAGDHVKVRVVVKHGEATLFGRRGDRGLGFRRFGAVVATR